MFKAIALVALAMPLEAIVLPHDMTCSTAACVSTTLGCYRDSNFDRILNGPNMTSQSMTWAMCQIFCAENNATFAGVEDGFQCFCGSAAPPSKFSEPAADVSGNEGVLMRRL